ncbi:MAG: FixH family protein [Caldimicrobium sp.]|nr:FixH family protein [Caldimicrobium sp.]MCX7873962.1 FixH family protein [Caldimicrobium sp.]MDW8094199.1 FixH family protein [Caldimicrobium sp.]
MIKPLTYFVLFIGLLIIFISIYIGKKTFDGKIYENTYELGLQYDKLKEAEKYYQISLEKDKLRVGENELLFKINNEAIKIYGINKIKVRISWIASNSYDREFEAHLIKNNVYVAKINFPFSGKWDLLFFLPYEREIFPLIKRIEVIGP